MRMRLKKHLNERIDNCAELLLAREGDFFYRLSEEEKKALRIDICSVFGNNNPIVLEIGCGKGSWAIQMAQQHPNMNFIAVEKLSNVIVAACEQAMLAGVNNLRFLNVRAENLGWYLPEKSASQIALNFSCPFPKKTYANRRLTSGSYLALYRRLLADGGYLTQKTDNKSFFEWSAESLAQNGFEVYDVCYDLPNTSDNIVTEYEAKFRDEGLPIYALKARLPARSESCTAAK